MVDENIENATQTQELPDNDFVMQMPPVQEENIQDSQTVLVRTDSYKLLNNAHIFVDSGIHEGATFRIISPITIGSSFDNDLILTDETIENTHLSLEPFETKLGYGIKVICKGSSALINGEEILTADQSMLFSESFIVIIGTVALKIHINSAGSLKTIYKKYLSPQLEKAQETTRHIQETVSPKKILSDIRNIIIIIMGVILLSITGFFIYNIDTTEKIQLNSHNMKYHELLLKKDFDNNQLQNQALKDLNMMLKQYDLYDRIKTYIEDKSIYISGRINFYENEKWGKVQNWYDATYGSNVTLVSLLDVNNGARRTISFKAVVSKGAMPFVVAWTGDRYRIGATLPGGWIILGINDKGVIVKDAIDNRVFLVEHIRMPESNNAG